MLCLTWCSSVIVDELLYTVDSGEYLLKYVLEPKEQQIIMYGAVSYIFLMFLKEIPICSVNQNSRDRLDLPPFLYVVVTTDTYHNLFFN